MVITITKRVLVDFRKYRFVRQTTHAWLLKNVFYPHKCSYSAWTRVLRSSMNRKTNSNSNRLVKTIVLFSIEEDRRRDWFSAVDVFCYLFYTRLWRVIFSRERLGRGFVREIFTRFEQSEFVWNYFFYSLAVGFYFRTKLWIDCTRLIKRISNTILTIYFFSRCNSII